MKAHSSEWGDHRTVAYVRPNSQYVDMMGGSHRKPIGTRLGGAEWPSLLIHCFEKFTLLHIDSLGEDTSCWDLSDALVSNIQDLFARDNKLPNRIAMGIGAQAG